MPNALELRALAYVLAALGFMFLGAHLAGLHYQAIIEKDRANVATLAAQAAEAAKAKQDLADANNARVVAGLNASLTSANAAVADFANRLRNSEARGRAVSAIANQPGTTTASGTESIRDLAQLCADTDAEDQRNAARLDALIAEIKPQL
jgi:hypothetical protein